jgi:hypothetical protein
VSVENLTVTMKYRTAMKVLFLNLDLSFRNADENDDKFYVLAVEHKTKVDLSQHTMVLNRFNSNTTGFVSSEVTTYNSNTSGSVSSEVPTYNSNTTGSTQSCSCYT